jgi:C-terminal processing protease CtpA/Prc
LTIPRGANDSFGFTVVGDSPTFIGKVNENTPADICGLKSGDFIVKINGQNVSRAQQRTVSNLIKYDYLILKKSN